MWVRGAGAAETDRDRSLRAHTKALGCYRRAERMRSGDRRLRVG